MGRRGNCYDNAVAEFFFSNLTVKRSIYATRAEAKSDIFDYIEGFYNRTRRHSYLGQLSPPAFEQLQFWKLLNVYESGGSPESANPLAMDIQS